MGNDYISRQAAIDDICETANDLQDVLIPIYYMGLIKALPAADVAPVVHGYWIRHDDADIVEGYYVPEYECSKCRVWKKDDSDFCPDCGAKMDGERKEEYETDKVIRKTGRHFSEIAAVLEKMRGENND